MPVWLSLFVALFGAVGFFATLYAVVIGIVEAKRAKAKPRIGIASGSRPGTFVFWANWQADTFNIQVYRLRVQLYNPNAEPKESVFTVSYDPLQKAPFQQEVEFPATFLAVLEKQDPKLEGIVTVDFRTIEEFTLPVNYKLSYVRKVAKGQGPKSKIANVLPATVADPATVMTLDYSELVVRKKKLRDLEAAAKAKAAKAPPPKAQPAAATASAATVAAASVSAAPVAGGSAPKPAAVKEEPKAAPAPAPAPAAKEEAPAPKAPAPKAAAPAPAPAPAPAKPAVKEDKPAASPRPETKLETAAKSGEIPSIRSVIKQANAKDKTPRPGDETSEVKPKS